MAARRRLTPWASGYGAVAFLAGVLFGYERWVRTGDRMLEEEPAAR